jgi:hypothetical protein
MTASWAKLRQVVIGTTDHRADVAAARTAFGLGEGFADPEVAHMSLVDATLPVSPGRYLEFVAPTDDTISFAKWLAKIGGRGGYVLSVQHPDPLACKERALARGIRVPVDVEAFGKPVVQIHPKDVGLLLELDGITDPDVWFWDDVDPGPEPGASIDGIVGVEVPVADPVAMSALWHELLDLGAPAKPDEIDLGGIYVRFVPGGPSADWTVLLKRATESATDSATDPGLPGITFRLV